MTTWVNAKKAQSRENSLLGADTRAQVGFNTSELNNDEPYDQLDFLATYTF
ncbi:hypothetical protein THOE12_70062 [Vibrio rotiferianus]|nr:hypothetical protein THOE12_70062 [Vibrio rotiferianus]